jgi:hypothetical protein
MCSVQNGVISQDPQRLARRSDRSSMKKLKELPLVDNSHKHRVFHTSSFKICSQNIAWFIV